MIRIIDSTVRCFFDDVESYKDIPLTDYLWILTLPSFGISVLLYLVLHII